MSELEDLIHSNEIFAGDLRTILEDFLKKRDPKLFTSMIQLIVGWQLCRQLPDFDDVTKIELKIYKGDQVAFDIKASDTTLLAIGPGERNETDQEIKPSLRWAIDFAHAQVQGAFNVERMDWQLKQKEHSAFSNLSFNQAEYRAERRKLGLPVTDVPELLPWKAEMKEQFPDLIQ